MNAVITYNSHITVDGFAHVQTDCRQWSRSIGHWPLDITWRHTTTTVTWRRWPITVVHTTACRCSAVTSASDPAASVKHWRQIPSSTSFLPMSGTTTTPRRIYHQVDNPPTNSSRQKVCSLPDIFRYLSMTWFPPDSGLRTMAIAPRTISRGLTVLFSGASTGRILFPVRRLVHIRWLIILVHRWRFILRHRHHGYADSRNPATEHVRNTGCRVITWSLTSLPPSAAGPARATWTRCGRESFLLRWKAYKCSELGTSTRQCEMVQHRNIWYSECVVTQSVSLLYQLQHALVATSITLFLIWHERPRRW